MTTPDDRLRIYFLHTWYHPAFSGHVLQLDRVRRRLRRHGLTLEVWTHRLPGTPAREWRDGVLVRRFGPAGQHRAARYLRRLHLMAWTIQKLDRTAILHHAGINSETRWALLPATLLRRKQVVHMSLLHADDPETLTATSHAWLWRRLYARVDRWIALSTALKDAYHRTRLPDDRVEFIPNATEIEDFAPPADKAAVRKRLGLPDGVPIVVSVGDMTPRKGFDILVEAIPKVLAAAPDALFLIVGPLRHQDPGLDAERQAFHGRLKARITELGIAGHVRFTGRQENLVEWLQAADVMAFPSRAEGLPNAVIEACAVGLPVVMADLPGISSDIIDDARSGFIVPQEDAPALARRLSQLLRSPSLREDMSRAARAVAVERFDLDRVAEKYLELYRAM